MGLEFLAFLDGFISVARLSAHLPTRARPQQNLHTSSHKVVVVGNKYLKGRHVNTFPSKANRRGGWRLAVTNTESVGPATGQ